MVAMHYRNEIHYHLVESQKAQDNLAGDVIVKFETKEFLAKQRQSQDLAEYMLKSQKEKKK